MESRYFSASPSQSVASLGASMEVQQCERMVDVLTCRPTFDFLVCRTHVHLQNEYEGA